MNDKELLELAAKAYGIPWPQNISGFQMQYDGARPWDPLHNDGDAMRLAVKLEMVVDTDHNGGAVAGNAKIALEMPEYGYQEGAGEKDIYAATRRAIVRAAAEIGRNMK